MIGRIGFMLLAIATLVLAGTVGVFHGEQIQRERCDHRFKVFWENGLIINGPPALVQGAICDLPQETWEALERGLATPLVPLPLPNEQVER